MSLFNICKNKEGDKKNILEAICPYCKKELLKFPGSKTKCPHCGNFIYVRTRPLDGQRILIRENQIKQIEKDWQKYTNIKDLKKSLQDANIGYTEEVYLTVKDNLIKKFGFNPPEGDILWGISNYLLSDAMKESDWHRMEMIYLSQALFLYNEGNEGYFKLLQLVNRCQLMDYKKSEFVKRVEIITCGDKSCLECQKLSGKIFTFEEAIKSMPIPVRDCSFKFELNCPGGWCRCMYCPVVD
jgi:hypothetical protein